MRPPITGRPEASSACPEIVSGPVVAPLLTEGAPPQVAPDPPKSCTALAFRLLRLTTSGTNEHPFNVGRSEYDPAASPAKL